MRQGSCDLGGEGGEWGIIGGGGGKRTWRDPLQRGQGSALGMGMAMVLHHHHAGVKERSGGELGARG